ncbi:MAG: ferredoxin-nitrite reductase [Solirubrobacteraceae bacterium]|nr:ferredoxin-nitrite reductase [Solirubrobacteraceae bacterium]
MNKHERVKHEKDPLDAREDLLRGARDGRDALGDDDLFRLKWHGLYEHNSKDGHFMLRVKVVQGILSAEQAAALAWIAEQHGRGMLDCTTRQCVQIHWITLEAMPEILRRLEAVGLTTTGACGDVTRNVIGCTLAGIAHDEIVDGYATALELHRRFLGNRAFSNLPRKYKISVTGCAEDCARGLINDLALSGAIAADGTRGFNLRVGGGLSAAPRFARWIDVFVTPEEAPEVVEHVTAIFRDADENRRARGKARMKFLLDRIGPDAFRAELEQRVGRPLTRGATHAPDLQGHDHIGVTPQRDGAHSAVGLCVPLGRLRSAQFQAVLALARDYGTGEIRLTHQQNVLIPHVPNERVPQLLAEPLVRDELRADPPLFTRGVQTCTGKEFCGLAKVFTKERAAEITAFLNAHVQRNGHGDDLRVHFAGCSSSCAQHQIADIGIEGVLKRVDGEMIEAMDIRIGGRLGPEPRFGDVVVKKVPHWELNAKLLEIFDLYARHHQDGETFREFAASTPSEWWQQQLSEAELAPAPA